MSVKQFLAKIVEKLENAPKIAHFSCFISEKSISLDYRA